MALTAAACGTGARPHVAEGPDATRPDEPPQTSVTPTEQVCDPTKNCVAQSKMAGAHPVYDQPGDSSPSQMIDRKQAEIPVVFLVIDDQPGWLEVYLPIRPNGSTEFVKKSDVDLSVHEWRIEVDLAEFNLRVFQGAEVFADIPIAVAADNTPTPGGVFYTTELLQPPEPDSVYGTYAYGLSGYSDVLQTFNGGPGQLGIHGTNRPELIGQKVSNGCIRMRNEDIEKLVPVLPLGVPVEVFAALPDGAVVEG